MTTEGRTGHKLPRAKPLVLTFYGPPQAYPYTTTFYVRDDTSTEECERLINAISALSGLVLGKYKIGYQEYVVPDYNEKLKSMTQHVMGTFKWVIKYQSILGMNRSVTIPGRDRSTSYVQTLGQSTGKMGKKPNPNHPKWQALTEMFIKLCVTKEGTEIYPNVELDYRNESYPPKGAKKRR